MGGRDREGGGNKQHSFFFLMFKKVVAQFVLLKQKYHRLGDLNNRNLFLIVLEMGKSNTKVIADSVPGENSPPGFQTVSSLLPPSIIGGSRQQCCKQQRGEKSKLSHGSCCKGTNHIHEGSSLMTSFFLPKVPLPNMFTLGIRDSAYEFWEDTNIQSTANGKVETTYKHLMCWLNYDKTI